MSYLEKNKAKLIQYLQSGCKSDTMPMRFGIELEHFIVKCDTKEAVSYYGENGVEAILKELQPLYEKSDYSEGHLIALSRKDIVISLEPASQLEVSISPQTDYLFIDAVYQQFLTEIKKILDCHSYELVTFGYQPHSTVDSLTLIPKERYRFMDRYFAQIGPYGKQMMRGTAATQVSIDYYSEEDFKQKYELAYRLKDFFAELFDNTPIYEGEEYKQHFLRKKIWEKTDKRRVDIEPFMHNGTLSFEDYAHFVMQTPIIVNIFDGNTVYDERTIGDLFEKRELDEEEIIHCLSMVFPMIRAKQFLEIRYVDSMKMEKALVYVLLIKGLFTDTKETLNWLRNKELSQYNTNKQKMEFLLKKASGYLSDKEIQYIRSR